MGLIEKESMIEWEEYRKIDLTKESWGGVGVNIACCLVTSALLLLMLLVCSVLNQTMHGAPAFQEFRLCI